MQGLKHLRSWHHIHRYEQHKMEDLEAKKTLFISYRHHSSLYFASPVPEASTLPSSSSQCLGYEYNINTGTHYGAGQVTL